MEACATKAGYSLILCDALGDVKKEKEYFKTLKYLFVDGILYIASTEDVEHVETIHRGDSHGDCKPYL